MPVVIQFSDGTYFRKTGRNTRKRVTELQKATTWEHAGHAKAAIRAAFEGWHGNVKGNWPRDFQIRKIKLVQFGKGENLSIQMDGNHAQLLKKEEPEFVERKAIPLKSELAADVCASGERCYACSQENCGYGNCSCGCHE